MIVKVCSKGVRVIPSPIVLSASLGNFFQPVIRSDPTAGIPTRQIVAFGAIQDDSDVLDPAHVPHHVVVNYYLRNGRLVTSVCACVSWCI